MFVYGPSPWGDLGIGRSSLCHDGSGSSTDLLHGRSGGQGESESLGRTTDVYRFPLLLGTPEVCEGAFDRRRLLRSVQFPVGLVSVSHCAG